MEVMNTGSDCNCGQSEELVQVPVKRLSYGPAAVADCQGKVLFVNDAAPGDTIGVKITKRHRRYLEGDLVHRCHHGQAYRPPPCPFHSRCGGCPWQHVNEGEQLAAKASILRETLRRIGGIQLAEEVALAASPLQWAYRNRVRLHVYGNRVVGFKALRSNEITEIDYCMVADPAINAELGTARNMVVSLSLPLEEIELVAVGDGRVVFVARAVPKAYLSNRDRDIVSQLLTARAGVAGVVIKLQRRVYYFGETEISWGLKEGRQPADVFSQVNQEANEKLIELVLAAAQLTGSERALEFHCGSGNLSFPIARRVQSLTAVDSSSRAVSAARKNAKRAGLTNIEFRLGDAASELGSGGGSGYDLVLLDPPRQGAPEAIAAVSRSSIARVVYVSCDPSTLARDAAHLKAAGYEIKSVSGVDLFPQTYHLEAVLSAVR